MKDDTIGFHAKVPCELTKDVQNVKMPSVRWKTKLGVKTTHPDHGVIYVGHLPHGFYELALHNYFSQFGEITRLSVARSRRTGNPRGFAFLEFRHKEVAKIAAGTMNNYLMYDKLLKCNCVPQQKVKPYMFMNSESRRLNWPAKRQQERSLLEHNRGRSVEELRIGTQRRLQKITHVRAKLHSLGIDYDLKPTNLSAAIAGGEEVKPAESLTARVKKVKKQQPAKKSLSAKVKRVKKRKPAGESTATAGEKVKTEESLPDKVKRMKKREPTQKSLSDKVKRFRKQ